MLPSRCNLSPAAGSSRHAPADDLTWLQILHRSLPWDQLLPIAWSSFWAHFLFVVAVNRQVLLDLLHDAASHQSLLAISGSLWEPIRPLSAWRQARLGSCARFLPWIRRCALDTALQRNWPRSREKTVTCFARSVAPSNSSFRSLTTLVDPLNPLTQFWTCP